MKKGDRVAINHPGSALHGMIGTISELDSTGSPAVILDGETQELGCMLSEILVLRAPKNKEIFKRIKKSFLKELQDQIDYAQKDTVAQDEKAKFDYIQARQTDIPLVEKIENLNDLLEKISEYVGDRPDEIVPAILDFVFGK